MSNETAEQVQEPAAGLYADFEALESEYAIPAAPFDLLLESGKVVQARALADAAAILQIERLVKNIQVGIKRGAVDPKAHDILPADPDMVRMCVYLSAFVLQPKRAWYEWVALSRTTGMLVPEIFNKLTAKVSETNVQAFDAEVEEEKND